MKIDGNYSNIYFGAKNKKTREADDIARLAKRTFPTLSSTYINKFNTKEKTSIQREKLIQELISKIHNRRKVSSYFEDSYPYSNIISEMEDSKAGNCYEMAVAVIAGLCANGYYNSKRGSLVLTTQIINKKTREVEYQTTELIDHCAVVTDMSNKIPIDHNTDEKLLTIIDPWVGFSGNISKAREEYKKVFNEEFKKSSATTLAAFAFKQSIKYDKIINVDDYETRANFSFKYLDAYTDDEMKEMGRHIIQDYKGLVKKPQNNQATGVQCVQDTSSVQT